MTTLRVSEETVRIVINEDARSIGIVSAGPEGPPGPAGPILPGGTDGQVLAKSGESVIWASVGTSEEVDAKLAAHDQLEEAHISKNSGRDFSALFLNGLV